MSNELQLSGAFVYQKGNSPQIKWSAVNRGVTLSGDVLISAIVSVGTSEEAIPLAEVSGSLGYMVVENLDDTNYIEIRMGTGASLDIIKVRPRKFAIFEWGSDVSAPYWIANTAACRVKYWLFSQ